MEETSVSLGPYDILAHVEGEVVEALEEVLGSEGLGALQGVVMVYRGSPMQRPLEVSVRVTDCGLVIRREDGTWISHTALVLGDYDSGPVATALDAVRALLGFMATWCDLHEAPEGLEYLWEASMFFRPDGDVLPC